MTFIDLLISLITTTADKFQKKERAAPFLAGALGAFAPYFFIMMLADSFGEDEVTGYALLLVCLPSIFLGTLLGGFLGLYTRRNWPEKHVFLVALVWGLIGSLIPASLWLFFS